MLLIPICALFVEVPLWISIFIIIIDGMIGVVVAVMVVVLVDYSKVTPCSILHEAVVVAVARAIRHCAEIVQNTKFRIYTVPTRTDCNAVP